MTNGKNLTPQSLEKSLSEMLPNMRREEPPTQRGLHELIEELEQLHLAQGDLVKLIRQRFADKLRDFMK